MRAWDVSAGYLNRQSLLGEHRELHGLHTIIAEGRKGYSRHPETLRWVGALTGLAWRHAHLAAEMRFRGYVDRSPLPLGPERAAWPVTFVTDPADQLLLLRRKYVEKSAGRIPLPRNAQQLWAQHKYSIMARDPEAYRHFGRVVAQLRTCDSMHDLAWALVIALREAPSSGRLVNALDHMWGHVRDVAKLEDKQAIRQGPAVLLSRIQVLAVQCQEKYLLSSTALSELSVYVEAS